ncbi:MAG: serine/threonine-protein kinase [Candidatus Eremiobacterota bacterium]
MNLPEEITSNYNVIERLGGEEGGNVYLVEDVSAGGLYVIKELVLPYYSSSPKIQKIINEISSTGEMLLNFSCHGLPKFFDFLTFDGTYYFLMEYINGDNLDAMCEKSRGFFPVQKVVSWVIKICDALSYLHSRDFIFKDLKPGHIIIDKSGEPWLVDFGLSRYAGLNIKSLHISYHVPPYFSSPEHYDKQDITRISDVYSLGATLYFVLTESFPLDARERTEGKEQLKKPSELNENISDDLDFIIMKSLNLNPEKRYQTTYAFKEDLEKFLARKEIFKGAPETFQKKNEEVLQDISEVATWGIDGKQKDGRKGLLRPKSKLLERTKSFPAMKKDQISVKDRDFSETPKNKVIEPHFLDKFSDKNEDRENTDKSDRELKRIVEPNFSDENEDRENAGKSDRELKRIVEPAFTGEDKQDKKREYVRKKRKVPELLSEQEDQIPVLSLIDNPDNHPDICNIPDESLSDDNRKKEDDFKKLLKSKSGKDSYLNRDVHKDYRAFSSANSKASDSLEERLKQIQITGDDKEKSGKFIIILCNIIAVVVLLAVLYMFSGRTLIAEWHFTRGKELMVRGNLTGSIAEFQHAMEFKEFKNHDIYFWAGKAYSLSGNKDDARRYLNNYLEVCPDGEFAGEAGDILSNSGEQ